MFYLLSLLVFFFCVWIVFIVNHVHICTFTSTVCRLSIWQELVDTMWFVILVVWCRYDCLQFIRWKFAASMQIMCECVWMIEITKRIHTDISLIQATNIESSNLVRHLQHFTSDIAIRSNLWYCIKNPQTILFYNHLNHWLVKWSEF